MVIEVHRLEWLGNIVILDGERTEKESLKYKPGRERNNDLD
jgi:hypothetical protein